ncbi:hypothetical protein BGC07_04835 [Piscirickettsia litoralis]|uniref:Diguanylate cyclase n=1 Tax=Piscirickettsia litoralis TaxID=1891921 RepID=A0ABX3A3Z8_9GAMM|nr:diguanylate cyclase [Piscirickettsia litoralis]ODN42383.1 hypothetical protein BGC07_04835 [Piscirickettsia litoralis]
MQDAVIRVLLIGQHPLEREAIRLALEHEAPSRYFYDITDVTAVDVALLCDCEDRVDCIILDAQAIDLNGDVLEVVGQLKNKQQGLPLVIALVEETSEKSAIALLKSRVAGYLVKDKKRMYLDTLSTLVRESCEKRYFQEKYTLLKHKSNAILDAVADGVVGIDEQENVNFANCTACKILGYSRIEELIGLGFNAIFKNTMHESLNDIVSYVKRVGAFESEVIRKKGGHLPVELYCSVINEKKEKIVIISFRDITKRKRDEAELVRLAQYDDLTKLANKSLFIELLGQAISRANRSKYYFALLFLDIDGFKEVNDGYGHDIGDKLLQEIAQRLKSCTRAHDIIARVGGDEFTIILEELRDEQDVFWVCEKIKSSLAYPFIVQGIEIEVAASIGIVTFNDIHHTPEALLRYADMAMYSAKRQGTGHYEVFNRAMSDHTKELIHLRAGIVKAIESDELFVQFQPKINTGNNKCEAVEALLRWKDDLYGVIEPAKFIPLAEEIGIINELGLWILKKPVKVIKN